MRISDWSSDVCSSDLADRQHPQGGFGLVRHHAIVNVHHEQRRSHGDDVDQQAGGDGVGVQPTRPLEGVAKPRTRPRDERAVVHVEFVLRRSEEHTSELQSLMRSSYAVFCLKKKKKPTTEESL